MLLRFFFFFSFWALFQISASGQDSYSVQIDIGGSMFAGFDTSPNDTAYDGTVYSGAQRLHKLDLPFFTVQVLDDIGVPQSGYVRVKTSGGKTIAAEYFSSTAGFNLNLANVVWHSFFDTDGIAPPHFDSSYKNVGDQSTGQSEFQITVQLETNGWAGIVTDSVVLNVTVSSDVTQNDPGHHGEGNLSWSWSEVPTVVLYKNGVLPPSGRPGPVAVGFNTTMDGQVVNNSGTDQSIEIWENVDGVAVKRGEQIIPAGATVAVDLGLDLAGAFQAYVTVSGEVTGTGLSSPNLVSGDSVTVDWVFPPQSKAPTSLVVDNSNPVDYSISVGSVQAPQQYINAPPGLSEYEVNYSGTVSVQGATEQFRETDSQGNITIVVSAPEGASPAVLIGTATVASSGGSSGGGGTTTASILQMPSGVTVTVGQPPLNPVDVPGPDGAATSSGVSVSSSSSGLVDEAAAQIAAIRAELEALASTVPVVVVGTSEQDADSLVIDLQTSKVNVESIFQDSTDGSFLIFDTVPEGRTFSQVSTVQLPLWDGNSMQIDLDFPAVAWLRTVFLVGLSVSWFLGLLRFARV